MQKKHLITSLGVAAAAAMALLAAPAHARGDASIHVQIGTGGYYPGYYPQPYVVAPPRYVQPAYVYTQPAYVYSQPYVYYGGTYYGGHRHHHRRDRDHDGVPNRFDRDRDGDGVPNRFDRRPNNPRRY